MTIYDELNSLLQQREAMIGDIDYETDPTITAIIDLMTRNMDETLAFLKDDCSENQFVWLSEVFDEIAEKSQDKALIETLREVADKYPEATREYNILYFIDSAEEYIKQGY